MQPSPVNASANLDVQLLAQRVLRLEKQNRMLKWAGGGMVAFACAALLMGQKEPDKKVVEAERFVLKGSGGHTRGTWDVNAEGATSLTLTDPKDAAAISIVVEKDGGGYITCNRPSGGRMLLQATDEAMGLRFWAKGEKNRPLAALLADPEGRTSLALGGGKENDAPLFITSGGEGAVAAINMKATDSQAKVRLGISRDGSPVLIMTDKKGETVHNVPSKSNGDH